MGITKLFHLRPDHTLEDVIHQVAVRIRETEPDFPNTQVEPEARRLVAEILAADPDASLAAIWTAAEKRMRDWAGTLHAKRVAAEEAKKHQQEETGVPGLLEANRSFTLHDEIAPAIPRWW